MIISFFEKKKTVYINTEFIVCGSKQNLFSYYHDTNNQRIYFGAPALCKQI